MCMLTLPSWLGQERGGAYVAAPADSSPLEDSGRVQSCSLCNTSIRLVIKKLFCSAATPFSGRMDVCLHTGQERVRD